MERGAQWVEGQGGSGIPGRELLEHEAARQRAEPAAAQRLGPFERRQADLREGPTRALARGA